MHIVLIFNVHIADDIVRNNNKNTPKQNDCFRFHYISYQLSSTNNASTLNNLTPFPLEYTKIACALRCSSNTLLMNVRLSWLPSKPSHSRPNTFSTSRNISSPLANTRMKSAYRHKRVEVCNCTNDDTPPFRYTIIPSQHINIFNKILGSNHGKTSRPTSEIFGSNQASTKVTITCYTLPPKYMQHQRSEPMNKRPTF